MAKGKELTVTEEATTDNDNRAYPHSGVSLTPRGQALCDFVFRDGPAAGLSDEAALVIGKLLLKHWDGTMTLVELFRRSRARMAGRAEADEWPEYVAG